MKEFKGTQGKWRINEEMGIIVTEAEIPDNVICMIPDEVCTQSRDNWDYNARLISKAPEMLELLNQSLRQLQSYGDLEPTFLTRKIEKLIKSATYP